MTNLERMKYLRGYTFWSQNAFWRTPQYSEKTQAEYERKLDLMRTGEKRLVRLQPDIGSPH